MKYGIKSSPMSAIEGFIIGAGILVIIANVILRDWGEVLDGLATTGLFWAWSSARRSSNAYERAFLLAWKARR